MEIMVETAAVAAKGASGCAALAERSMVPAIHRPHSGSATSPPTPSPSTPLSTVAAVLERQNTTRKRQTLEKVLLLYLNRETFSDDNRSLLCRQLLSSLIHGGMVLYLVHENAVEKGGCDFDHFLSAVPQELLECGIFNMIASPWFSGTHRIISIKLTAQLMGAKEEKWSIGTGRRSSGASPHPGRRSSRPNEASDIKYPLSQRARPFRRAVNTATVAQRVRAIRSQRVDSAAKPMPEPPVPLQVTVEVVDEC